LAGGQSDRSALCASRVCTTSPPALRQASTAWQAGTMACSSDVVAQRFAKAARLDEVALHVDDDQGRVRQLEVVRKRGSAWLFERSPVHVAPSGVIQVSAV
jgi:hypothetical protein